MNLEYSEAIGETLQVLKKTEKVLIDKIPKKLLEFFERNAAPTKELNIEISKDLTEIDLKPKSKALIGMIYRNYWCDAEERKAYDEILKQNEQKFQESARERYNPEDIFKKTEEKIVEEKQEVRLSIYKENIFMKIINKIKSILNIKN